MNTTRRIVAVGEFVTNETAIRKIAELREENARLREALEYVCSVLFHDAVNGHLNDAQVITREQICNAYEVARIALKGTA